MRKGRYYKYAKDDGRCYQGISYPIIQQKQREQNCVKIITKEHQRLDLLAKKYFNDSKLWWIIAIFNDIPGDSIRVPVGTELFIPRNYIKYV